MSADTHGSVGRVYNEGGNLFYPHYGDTQTTKTSAQLKNSRSSSVVILVLLDRTTGTTEKRPLTSQPIMKWYEGRVG